MPLAPWNFAELEVAVKAALLQAQGSSPPEGITWTGPLLTTNDILTSCPNIDEQLTTEKLAEAQERGRDPVDVVIGIALQLGIEQGRRTAAKDKAELVDCAIIALERLRSAVGRV